METPDNLFLSGLEVITTNEIMTTYYSGDLSKKICEIYNSTTNNYKVYYRSGILMMDSEYDPILKTFKSYKIMDSSQKIIKQKTENEFTSWYSNGKIKESKINDSYKAYYDNPESSLMIEASKKINDRYHGKFTYYTPEAKNKKKILDCNYLTNVPYLTSNCFINNINNGKTIINSSWKQGNVVSCKILLEDDSEIKEFKPLQKNFINAK